MRLTHPWLLDAAGFAAATAIRAWMGTLDYKALFHDPAVDPIRADGGQRIYIFWHEYILFPISLRGHCNLTMLLSRHRDAEVLDRAARRLGFGVVRGSTRRGGVAALRELLRESERMHLTLTPDGPRGPRRILAAGPVYLASRLGLPLVPMGFGFNRPWRLRSWDRFAIPRPFSRARTVVGPPLTIPPGLDRAGLEHHRGDVERLMNRLTDEAEEWAMSGAHRPAERVLRAGRAA